MGCQRWPPLLIGTQRQIPAVGPHACQAHAAARTRHMHAWVWDAGAQLKLPGSSSRHVCLNSKGQVRGADQNWKLHLGPVSRNVQASASLKPRCCSS